MSAKDIYHHYVRRVMEKYGWTVTHDPLMLRYGKKDLFVDLGAKNFMAAEKFSSIIIDALGDLAAGSKFSLLLAQTSVFLGQQREIFVYQEKLVCIRF